MNPPDPACAQPPRDADGAPGWRRVLAAAALAALAALLAHALFAPTYQTNDDPAMELRTRGIALCDRPDPYLMVTHIFVGRALAALSEAVPGVVWYRVYMVGVRLLAGVVVYHLILRRSWGVRGLVLALLYLLNVDVFLYVRPQFTVTGGLASASALLLWADRASRGEALGRGELATVLVLFVLAVLTRVESALLILAAAAPGAAFLVARAAVRSLRCGEAPREVARGVGRLGLPLALVLVAVPALSLANARAYARMPGFADYYEYNRLAARFVDYNHIRYDERTRWIFDRVGWSENDLRMFQSWAFTEPDLFSLEKIRTIVTLFDRFPPASAAEPERIVGRFGTFDRHGWFWTIYGPMRQAYGASRGDHLRLALLLCPLLLGVRRGALPVLALSLAAGLGLIGYLYDVVDRCPPRVYQPVIAYLAALGMIATADGPAWRDSRRLVRAGRALVVVALVMATALALDELRQMSAVARRRDAAFLSALRRVGIAPDRLFINWAIGLPYELLSLDAPPDALRGMKLYSFAGMCRTPVDRARLEESGIEDVYRAMYTREDVTVFCDESQAELLVRYAKEHHGEEVTYTGRVFVISEEGPVRESFRITTFRLAGSRS